MNFDALIVTETHYTKTGLTYPPARDKRHIQSLDVTSQSYISLTIRQQSTEILFGRFLYASDGDKPEVCVFFFLGFPKGKESRKF